MNSKEILIRDLISLGVREGDVLLVHSSLSSMGQVEGGADTVIDALLEVLGKDGTLLFPAFSFSPCYKTSEFSYNDTPSCVGKISETFRKREGVIRSFHPTHSVTAIGKHALELIRDHEKDDTPVGVNSPLRKLPRYNGKILMLGCSLHSNSFMHGMEELAEVFYVLRGHQEYTMIDKDGNRSKTKIRRHNFARENGVLHQRYNRSLDVLDEGDYWIGKVHGAECVLMDSVALEIKAVKKMKENPTYFIDDPDGLLK